MREFNQMIKERAPLIKKSILEAKGLEKKPKDESKNDKENDSNLE